MLKRASKKAAKRTTKTRSAKKIVSRKTTKTISYKRASTPKRRVRNIEQIEYVLPLGNGWVVKNNLAGRFTAITDTKKEAILIARKIARVKRNVLIVHGRDGRIELRENH